MLALSVVAAIALSIAAGGDANPSLPDVSSLRRQAGSLGARQHAALLDLYSVQTRLTAARRQLARVQTAAARVRAERALVGREVAVASHVHAVSQRQLAERLRLLYERGRPDPVAVLLGATSLDDAISSIDALNRSARQDNDVIRQTAQTHRRLARLSSRLAARTARVAALERAATASVAALERAQGERQALVASLHSKERLTRRQISSLVVTAQAAQAKTQALSAAAAPVPVAGPAEIPTSATSSGQTMAVSATGYSLPGQTATGLPVGWGIVAVDPAVIPLGTHMTVPGYGEAVAADVGSAVRGATIDLWFPTLEQARAWGRRTVTITLH